MLQPFITPYSPDLSPPNYFLFPKLKVKLKGLHFADVAEIQEAVTDELKKVQKEEFSADCQKVYDRTKACMYVCVCVCECMYIYIYMPMELILN
jgi:hypothetical protein